MMPLASFAEHLCAASSRPLDGSLVETVRQRIFDTLGATAVGFATTEGQMLAALDAGLDMSGQGQSEMDRCRLLVGVTRSTEVDDIDIGSCTTVGSVIVPVALTLAAASEAKGSDTIGVQRIMAGIVTGYEAMIRLGRAIDGAALIYRGIWPTYVTAAFASAATIASVLEFDTRRFASALGLALSRIALVSRSALAQPAYRQFALGAAAADGWMAALAARAGFTQDAASFDTFANSIGVRINADALTANWEHRRITDVDTKCFPSSRQALASVEAFTKVLPLNLGEIESIEVYVPAPYRDMVDQPRPPDTRIGSMIGVQYQMALAAVGSPVFFDALRAALPFDREIQAWMARIHVHADADLSAQFPAIWGSRVDVRLTTGKISSVEVLRPKGSAELPLGWDGLQEKFESVIAAGGLVGSSAVRDLRNQCHSFGADGSAGNAEALLSQAEGLGEALRRSAVGQESAE
jgi:2-methylcitrate dehydratase PrpD